MSCKPTKKNVRIKGICLACFAVATTIFWLPGCRSTQTPQATNTSGPRNIAADREATDQLSQPFRAHGTVFDSQLAFLESKVMDRCSTVAPPLEKRQQIDQSLKTLRDRLPTERASGSIEIRVYFHVLTNADGSEGGVSDAAINHQIEVLNVAYAGNGPGGTGAATPFKFVLAGTDRTANDEWFNMIFKEVPAQAERDAKATLNKGDKSSLNIYTARLFGSPYGWARWPWDLADGVDGIVVRYSTLPGGSTIFYNEGDTATHEIGHWLGLFHTSEGGCAAPGDSVDDTPPEESPARFCPVVRNTCPDAGYDPVENFMNYTYDGCMFQFTRGQSERMDATYLAYRT